MDLHREQRLPRPGGPQGDDDLRARQLAVVLPLPLALRHRLRLLVCSPGKGCRGLHLRQTAADPTAQVSGGAVQEG